MRLQGAAAVGGHDHHGRRQSQSRLPEPALQGADGRNLVVGVQVLKFQAEATGSPTAVETAEAQTRLLEGQARGREGASAAVEVRREVEFVGQTLPGEHQVANGADGQGQVLGNEQGSEARLPQIEDLLALGERGRSRHR